MAAQRSGDDRPSPWSTPADHQHHGWAPTAAYAPAAPPPPPQPYGAAHAAPAPAPAPIEVRLSTPPARDPADVTCPETTLGQDVTTVCHGMDYGDAATFVVFFEDDRGACTLLEI